MHRRAFLATALSATRILGANDRVRVGLIGCGGRGRYVAKFMSESPNAQFVAFADVYQNSAAEAKAWAGGEASQFQDFRKLLELKDVDAVQVATPDHWHGLVAVLACQAGKDVYVEKPISHNIAEGRAMVQAARKYKRVVFAGTQQRSAPHFAELANLVQSGGIGKVHLVRVWNFSNMLPDGIGRVPDSDPPNGLDWDMYLGPAPKVPYNRKRFQSTFRWFWDYAGGTITDFGTHRFDTVHQIMGADRPVGVSATGGRYELKDAGEMPDTMEVTYEYPGFLLQYEMSNINSHGMGGRTPGMKYYHGVREDDRPHGMAFYGSEGTIFADRIGFDVYPEADKVKRRHENTIDATSIHAKRFIEAVRNRTTYNADIEVGHRATTVALLGNIAMKTGEKLRWDAEKETTNSAAANKMLRRQARKPWDLLA
jgi:predicted dehydrogenase